ncbi:uncharacterized protein BJ171DRAFT_173151 [Polychytrium aggregatum]|uniref:uncharacterized protein n=1 Tax=Polychytrium aggregatum TaxID=110093 RepID=UPI0022FF2A98|nr:uncharacterized protein BJ171DRAFT_173151 [Polychytrium aggregatum]KAI9209009.1 hypothetical protein BJ171DRAFT_173151 [Polychytrium aggregatum]
MARRDPRDQWAQDRSDYDQRPRAEDYAPNGQPYPRPREAAYYPDHREHNPAGALGGPSDLADRRNPAYLAHSDARPYGRPDSQPEYPNPNYKPPPPGHYGYGPESGYPSGSAGVYDKRPQQQQQQQQQPQQQHYPGDVNPARHPGYGEPDPVSKRRASEYDAERRGPLDVDHSNSHGRQLPPADPYSGDYNRYRGPEPPSGYYPPQTVPQHHHHHQQYLSNPGESFNRPPSGPYPGDRSDRHAYPEAAAPRPGMPPAPRPSSSQYAASAPVHDKPAYNYPPMGPGDAPRGAYPSAAAGGHISPSNPPTNAQPQQPPQHGTGHPHHLGKDSWGPAGPAQAEGDQYKLPSLREWTEKSGLKEQRAAAPPNYPARRSASFSPTHNVGHWPASNLDSYHHNAPDSSRPTPPKMTPIGTHESGNYMGHNGPEAYPRPVSVPGSFDARAAKGYPSEGYRGVHPPPESYRRPSADEGYGRSAGHAPAPGLVRMDDRDPGHPQDGYPSNAANSSATPNNMGESYPRGYPTAQASYSGNVSVVLPTGPDSTHVLADGHSPCSPDDSEALIRGSPSPPDA